MGPLIVQSDRTVLLELDHEDADDARRELAAFAELERAPEHVHTYRITPLGLWNARAAGLEAPFTDAELDQIERDVEGFGPALYMEGICRDGVEPPAGADRATRLLARLGRRA